MLAVFFGGKRLAKGILKEGIFKALYSQRNRALKTLYHAAAKKQAAPCGPGN